MPLWVSLLLWQVVVPVMISLLRKWGYINLAEALAAKAVLMIKNLKNYHEPKDFPHAPEVETNQHNFTVGQKGEPKP